MGRILLPRVFQGKSKQETAVPVAPVLAAPAAPRAVPAPTRGGWGTSFRGVAPSKADSDRQQRMYIRDSYAYKARELRDMNLVNYEQLSPAEKQNFILRKRQLNQDLTRLRANKHQNLYAAEGAQFYDLDRSMGNTWINGKVDPAKYAQQYQSKRASLVKQIEQQLAIQRTTDRGNAAHQRRLRAQAATQQLQAHLTALDKQGGKAPAWMFVKPGGGTTTPQPTQTPQPKPTPGGGVTGSPIPGFNGNLGSYGSFSMPQGAGASGGWQGSTVPPSTLAGVYGAAINREDQLARGGAGLLQKVQEGYQGLVSAAQNRESNLTQFLTGLGDAQKSKLASQYQQQQAQSQQSLINRGLGNMTVADSVTRGINLDYTRALGELNDKLTREQMDYRSALSGDTMAARESALQYQGNSIGDWYAMGHAGANTLKDFGKVLGEQQKAYWLSAPELQKAQLEAQTARARIAAEERLGNLAEANRLAAATQQSQASIYASQVARYKAAIDAEAKVDAATASAPGATLADALLAPKGPVPTHVGM